MTRLKKGSIVSDDGNWFWALNQWQPFNQGSRGKPSRKETESASQIVAERLKKAAEKKANRLAKAAAKNVTAPAPRARRRVARRKGPSAKTIQSALSHARSAIAWPGD
jgi:hypothetical protein